MQLERRQVMDDRRRGRRVNAVFAVKNTVGNRMLLGQAEDIGTGGIAVRRPKDLPFLPLTPVSLTFELPGSRQRIAANGLVVNDRPVGGFRRTGVCFTDIDPSHAALIERYCASE